MIYIPLKNVYKTLKNTSRFEFMPVFSTIKSN